MKNYLGVMSLLVLVISTICASAQSGNLVVNPGLEQINQCPPYVGGSLGPWGRDGNHLEYGYVIGWSDPTGSRTGYINEDCPPPYAISGRNSKGYAGLLAIAFVKENPPNIAIWDYLQGTLQTKLEAGQYYCVEFYVYSGSSFVNSLPTKSNCISLKFVDTVKNYRTNDSGNGRRKLNLCELEPDVTASNGPFLTVSNFWHRVKGLYKATGTEGAFIIGNFQDAYEVNYAGKVPNTIPDEVFISYYIDDVSVTPAPFDKILTGDSLLCVDDTSATLTAAPGFLSYLWSTGDTTQSTTAFAPGVYSVRVKSDCGEYTETINLRRAGPPPPFSLPDTGYCQGIPLRLEAPASYAALWSTGATTPAISIAAGGSYSLTLANQCGSQTASFVVSQKPMPLPRRFITGDSTLCKNGVLVEGRLEAQTSYNLRWLGFPPEIAGSAVPVIHPRLPGWYRAQEYNDCGQNTDSVYLTGCRGIIAFPTAFSPNGDGRNDRFRPIVQDGRRVRSYQLMVFDRWGQKMHSGTQPTEGWDGTLAGRPVEAGVYFWRCIYREDGDGGDKEIAGDVTLVW